MVGKYRVSTLGCKVNQYETQVIRSVLEACGLRRAFPNEKADLAVVNTCAVTSTALSKSRQAVRRLARHLADAVVVVGCGASADARRFERISGVCAVLDHDADIHSELQALVARRFLRRTDPPCEPEHLRNDASVEVAIGTRNDKSYQADAPRRVAQREPASADPSTDMIIPTALPVVNSADSLTVRIERFDGHQRAFLKVQDGCDAHCTYCIIPTLRSSPRWKPIQVAVEEASALVAAGHREIVLTGIFLGAYGRDTALRRRWKAGAAPLARLVDAVAGVEGLARLRLSSLEPGDVDQALLEVLARRDNCVPHLHLPLQSGSGEILRRMNRQYTREEFVRMVDHVEQALDRPAISTDLIVGFPGESEQDFQDSLDLARYANFVKIHAFPFSPRDGTAAARWGRQFVPGDVVRERMSRVMELEAELSLTFRRRFAGHVERVLVEDVRESADVGFTGELCSGRADRYFTVHFVGPGSAPGDLVDVAIERVTPARTHGRQINSSSSFVPIESVGAC